MSNPVLEPVEGITVEQWAKAQASMASGGNLEDACKMLGIDAPKWDRVSAEWMARMTNDTAFVIMPIYSAAFTSGASGNMGAGTETNENTISFEKFAEVIAAQDVLTKTGRDAQDILQEHGMTLADYSNVSSYWSTKIATDIDLGIKFEKLINEYKAKYESMAGADSHSDLEF